MDLNAFFDEGCTYYKLYGEISTADLRSKHPMWRAGYNTARTQVHEAQSNVPKVLYKVDPINLSGIEMTWNQILGITKKPRYRLLHEVPELYPILSAIMHKAYSERTRIRNYLAMSAYVGALFDAVLEYGYKVGELTQSDLAYNGYKS